MRTILIVLAFALGVLPAAAQSPIRKWVRSGTQGGLTICVDQNSIAKQADGLTHYVVQVFCKGSDDLLREEAVNCDQDMSGLTVPTKGRPLLPLEDGSHEFGSTSTKTCSLMGQTAKFVCKKPGPYQSCVK